MSVPGEMMNYFPQSCSEMKFTEMERKMKNATNLELQYLSYLGLWRPSKYREFTARELLQKYRDTVHLRENWGNIDQYVIYEHICKLMAKEMTKKTEK